MDWLSTILGFSARYLTGEKNPYGWLLAICGGGIAFYLQAKAGYYGLCVGNLGGMIMSVYYFFKWRRDEERK